MNFYRVPVRRLTARIVLPFFIVFMCLFPAKKSEAFLPLLAIAYVFSLVTEAGITLTASDLVGLSIIAAGSGTLLYFKITATDGSGSVATALQDEALFVNKLIPPPFVSPPATPYYASSYAHDPNYNCEVWGNSLTDACNNLGMCLYENGFFSSSHVLDAQLSGVCSNNSGPIGIIEPVNAFVCPYGSTKTGIAPNISCVVYDARAIVDDKRFDYSRGFNSFYLASLSDKGGSIVPNVAFTHKVDDSLSFTGKASVSTSVSVCGLDCLQTVTSVANADGSTTITTNRQSYDITGQPFVVQQTLNIGSAGVIVDSASVTLPGQIIDANVVGSNGAAVVVPYTGTGTGTGTGTAPSPPIVFPNDYARSGEAATAATSIVTALSPLTTTASVVDPVVPASSDMPGWTTTFDGLNGWRLPSHSSACPQPTLDLTNVGLGIHVLNSHCALMADHGSTIRQSMVVVFSVLALFLILAA